MLTNSVATASCAASLKEFHARLWPNNATRLTQNRLALVQNEQFDPLGNRHCEACARRPNFQQNKLPNALVQYRKFDTRDVGRRRERKGGGVDAHRRSVVRVELPELDEDRAAGIGTGRVAARR